MYEKFQKINGTHPWRDVSELGYVDYPVRYRKGGKVLYFNFPLAREIGLIAKDHPARLNAKLEKAILETFSLQIINEYDQENKVYYPSEQIKKNPYMATRYLQSQHKNKLGKTSGDGRSIWNGCLKTRRRIFDFSSGGTGNTILSPGSQDAGKPVKTGDESYGYSSGLADLDEMLSSAIMSEIFYRRGLPTERCLTVIDFKDNTAIGVRTAPNLLRPAHIFRYLKMGLWAETKKSFDYFLKRQETNGNMELPKSGKGRYLKALQHLTRIYSRLAAVMEEEYIFNWLAWDGDNMLASGAILDYGSIRQFAAKHDKYRYDDVDRFSTCLTEQRVEAKRLIQTFVQIVDFILTKDKKNIKEFIGDKHLQQFDEHFISERQKQMLVRVGFSDTQVRRLLIHHQSEIQEFRKVLNYFEVMKTQRGVQKVPDGIDHPPIFLVRHILRELPAYVLEHRKGKEWPIMPAEQFCEIMAASYTNAKELQLNESRRQKAEHFQRLYHKLLHAAGEHIGRTLRSVTDRSAVINYANRATGDGITWICQEAAADKRKLNRPHFQEAIDRFIESQVLIPGKWKALRPEELKGKTPKARQLTRIHETLEIYNEKI